MLYIFKAIRPKMDWHVEIIFAHAKSFEALKSFNRRFYTC